MKRTNAQKGRGVDPKFVPISWDEALNTIADRMIELRKNNEAHKLVYMRGRYSPTSTDLLYGSLPKIYGTTNYFSHSAICAEAEKMGPGLTQGFFGYRDYDLPKTNCLVLWGTDPLASNREVPNTIANFHEIVARGTVIAIDPRLSNVAAKAHEWLPVKPGTDGALAGAIAHVLLTEGMWSREFVGDFKDGKNQFVAGQAVGEAAFAEKDNTFGLVRWWNIELKDRTPAWAEKETLIPAAQIVRVARAMGKAAPKTVVWMGPGVAMNPRGTYTAMAVYALNGILGSIDVEGGVWQSSSVPIAALSEGGRVSRRRRQGRGQVQEARRPRRQGHAGDDERAARQRCGHQQRCQRHAEGPGGVQGVHLVVVELQLLLHRRAALGQGDGRGAVLRAHGDQPVGDDPVRRHRAARDVQLVRRLVGRHQHGQRLRLRVDPAGRGEAAVGRQAGGDRGDVAAGREAQGQGVPEPLRLLLEGVQGSGNRQDADQRDGVLRDRDQDIQLVAVEAERAAEGRRTAHRLGRLPQEGHFQRRAVHAEEGLGRQVRHRHQEVRVLQRDREEGPGGAREEARDDGGRHPRRLGLRRGGQQAFVPHYEPPKRHGSLDEYPFTFVDYKSRLNREGRSANLAWYQEFKKVDPGDVSWDDVLKMNPADGAKLGLKTGDSVRVTSPSGAMVVKLKLWEGLRPGTVAKCYGQGHWAYGRVAALDYAKALPRGGSNNDILVDDYDRLSGATARNGGFTGVRIQKA